MTTNYVHYEGETISPEKLPKAVGWRIIIAPVKIQEQTAGGILLTTDTQKLAETTRFIGKVISMGPLCYKHEKFKHHPSQDTPQPWCKVGDVVSVSSYAGSKIPMKHEDGEEFSLKIINDDEVLSVITDLHYLNI